MTHQPETDCPTPETHNWGCGCPTDVAAAIASCPGHEVDGPSPCRCPCEGCKHNCAAHQAAAVSAAVAPPTNQTTTADAQHMLTRMRADAATHDHAHLLRLIAAWAASSEGRDALLTDLVAAGYRLPHADRTATDPALDRTALREQIAAALYERERPPGAPAWTGALAADREVFEAMADAVLTVLPEPTDRAAVLAGPERKMLDYALDQAQERIWSEDGFTDEDQAAVDSLRRLTAECPECGDTGACNGGPCPLRRMADKTATETPCTCFVINDGGVHAAGCAKRAAGQGQGEPSLRDQHRAAWHALTPDQQTARLAELDADDEPAAGARQDGAET